MKEEIQKNDLVLVVDASLGDKVALPCHYCGSFMWEGKQWYKTNFKWPYMWKKTEKRVSVNYYDKSNVLKRMATIDKRFDATYKRFVKNKDDSLTITDIQYNDTGMYYCHSSLQRIGYDKQKGRLAYLIDFLLPQNQSKVIKSDASYLPVYEGKVADWNRILQKKKKSFFKDKEFYIKPGEWSACDACENNLGTKERLMELRLSSKKNKERAEGLQEIISINDNAKVGLHVRSTTLSKLEPEWYAEFSKIFVEFTMKALCTSPFPCSKKQQRFFVQEGISHRKRKRGKPSVKAFTKTITEGGHFTLKCPKVIKNENVFWFNGSRRLTKVNLPMETSGRAFINGNKELEIVDITKYDSVEFNCYSSLSDSKDETKAIYRGRIRLKVRLKKTINKEALKGLVVVGAFTCLMVILSLVLLIPA